MPPLTLTEIDRELATRTEEIDRVAATLLDLDKHPGLTLLRRFGPTGATLARWEPIRAALDLMWEDFGRMRAILDQAAATRGGKHRLTEPERAELTRLLRGRPHEAARTPIPLARRTVDGPSETVLFVGLADTLDRMRAYFPEIAEFLDEVDAANTRAGTGLAPLQERLDRLGHPLPALSAEIADLLARSATDPLSLTDIETRVAALTDRLSREAALLAELEALRADWPAAHAATATRLTALAAAVERAHQARIEAEHTIRTGPLPTHPDPTPGLRTELAALTHPDAAALLALRRRIDAALAEADHDCELARGLLERRRELRGRLGAYQVKAARLGVGEDRDVLASHRIAQGLLARTPCDLAAVTRAVADYQQVIGAKSGRRA
ncbi:hypothetical protein D5S18_05820 [Nocardia panacis]|uniref:Uncharacterized protein n=1 Tax=Nocardia panacis TaxID=2340916 RepID=A0A3A4KRC6_9NOCA|nr:hypothetical protein [Nocardia panacis]RJO78410.1 hypothetical protein D5S18_05820 [Nocardia panacis]